MRAESARWVPTSYKRSYEAAINGQKIQGVNPINGALTLLITERGPPCRILDDFSRS